MVAHEGNSGEYHRAMEAGFGNLIHRMEGLVVSGDGDESSSGENHFQVLKAIEAAELTIQKLLIENKSLKTELHATRHEIDNYGTETTLDHPAVGSRDAHGHSQGSYALQNSGSTIIQEIEKNIFSGDSPQKSSPGTLVVCQDIHRNIDDCSLHVYSAQSYDQACNSNGTLTRFADELIAAENSGFSQVPSSPSRNQNEEEYNLSSNVLTHGMMQVSDAGNLDLVPKIRERDEEIMQLKNYIADYAMKEAQIRNEKCILEKKISYMRTALDQQQQDLVDAVSKATSYRLDILDENIRLSLALQVARQECSIFVSSLFHLLAEFDMKPQAMDAQSIVGNLKILIENLRQQINFSEMNLKGSQYELVPCRTDQSGNTFPLQISSHQSSGLDMVPQQMYSQPQTSTPSLSAVAARDNGENSGNHQYEPVSMHLVTRSPTRDDQGSSSSRTGFSLGNAVENSVSTHSFVTQASTHALQQSEIYTDRNHLYSSFVHEAMDGANLLVQQRPTGVASALEDPSTSFYSPHLPPVSEEPSSSCSEAADDELLPAIEGLQIRGEAFPGNQIEACGYSINGTAACNCAWIREAEDGSVTYITGANQPAYVVTADDVDSRLAIEIVPMDNQKRKGDLIREFANGKKKITCEPSMQEKFQKILSDRHASFSVLLSNGLMDIWGSATLNIKSEGYTIKCNEPRVADSQKFSDNIYIEIPYGHSTEFLIQSSRSALILRAQDNWHRDLIVLTLRLFQKLALQHKRKGKKKMLFF
ncbi:uncharacterized protein LOC116260355 isoform X3 [Nymphaea colorata]|uniref:uncharacterized protein LOC116260355 isoform X3 n=1 Tax=Nymphaea colorata TaxID=210225 RepID=UPI00129E19EC|nr:uncharacterized protein LOC116260355 isoform X3 [Nymphaea colorata]